MRARNDVNEISTIYSSDHDINEIECVENNAKAYTRLLINIGNKLAHSANLGKYIQFGK